TSSSTTTTTTSTSTTTTTTTTLAGACCDSGCLLITANGVSNGSCISCSGMSGKYATYSSGTCGPSSSVSFATASFSFCGRNVAWAIAIAIDASNHVSISATLHDVDTAGWDIIYVTSALGPFWNCTTGSPNLTYSSSEGTSGECNFSDITLTIQS